jgi:pantetheine-phosphate adenylyltransferase
MKTAVYAGSFDPVTNGHIDIVTRAAKVFDQIIMAVAKDNGKNGLFTPEERVELVQKAVSHLDNVTVDSFSGLLVNYCMEKEVNSVIRGLRVVSDFEKEFQMALMNRKLERQVDTVFLMSGAKYMFISSSLIKETAKLGGAIETLVPEHVAKALAIKYR